MKTETEQIRITAKKEHCFKKETVPFNSKQQQVFQSTRLRRARLNLIMIINLMLNQQQMKFL